MTHQITFHTDPAVEDVQVLLDDYQAFTEAQIGKEERREIAFFVRD